MPGSSSNSSFIPKRGTQKRKRRVRNANVYILTIVSYIILFTTLVASGAVYIYSQFVSGQLQDEIALMSSAVGEFKEADLQRVKEFDVRLQQANERLTKSVSVASIFSAIESATIDTVRFDTFSLKRNQDEGFVINAAIETDSFDSSLFQRGIFEDNEVVSDIEIDNLTIQEAVDESGLTVGNSVSFIAHLAVPLEAVPYEITPTDVPVIELPPPVIETPTEDSVEESVDVNQTDV